VRALSGFADADFLRHEVPDVAVPPATPAVLRRAGNARLPSGRSRPPSWCTGPRSWPRAWWSRCRTRGRGPLFAAAR
jgi:hypothetical protein